MTRPRPEYVSLNATRRALHALYGADPECSATNSLMRVFEDELAPIDTHGRWKPNKLLVIAAGIVFSVVFVFIYFSLR